MTVWTEGTIRRGLGAFAALCLALTGCGNDTEQPAANDGLVVIEAASSGDDYTFGMVLTGPIADGSWNENHFEGGKYVVEHLPGTTFLYVDVLNETDRPEATLEQAAEELISQGAQFVIMNSAEYADPTDAVAAAHPDVQFVHTSGDNVWEGTAPPNVINLMGRMEYAKMLAGCAAALQSQTGGIAYVGPLIDHETRRLVNSAYLGAQHCTQKYKGRPADALRFTVDWIGFWFNIPGVTRDASDVAAGFIEQGNDVLISGIDSPEPLVEAERASRPVWAAAQHSVQACMDATSVCLGVPFLNWGPEYLRLIEAARDGEPEQSFEWVGPDWQDLASPDGGLVGFRDGPALTLDNAATLEAFKDELAAGLNLFAGPLYYQDGTEFVAAGATPTDEQLWYTEQLLAGIDGPSEP